MQETLNEEEKKKQRLLDREITDREKQVSLEHIKLDIERLKELVKEWVVDAELVELFSSDGIVTAEELQAIIDEVRLEDVLTKIDEVEQYEHIPADLKISRSEFVLALQDSTAKAQVLQKIDDILWYLYIFRGGWHKAGWTLFSSLLYLFDKKMVAVQWHALDLKHYLYKPASSDLSSQ